MLKNNIYDFSKNHFEDKIILKTIKIKYLFKREK